VPELTRRFSAFTEAERELLELAIDTCITELYADIERWDVYRPARVAQGHAEINVLRTLLEELTQGA
jgi:hypothetical protein